MKITKKHQQKAFKDRSVLLKAASKLAPNSLKRKELLAVVVTLNDAATNGVFGEGNTELEKRMRNEPCEIDKHFAGNSGYSAQGREKKW